MIHVQATGSGPAVYAENVSGPAIQADGTIKAIGPGSAPAIRATGSSGRAIEAQSTSIEAIKAVGSPGIDAVGSTSSPAIHAVGSNGAPGIRVEASASAPNAINAAAIYAEGSLAHAIYAKGTGSADAIHAEGSTLGPALFVNGGFGVKVRQIALRITVPTQYPILIDDHVIIITSIGPGPSPSPTSKITLILPQSGMQDGQMFIFRNFSDAASIFINGGNYTIILILSRAGAPASSNEFQMTNPDNNLGYNGATTIIFYQGCYYQMFRAVEVGS